MRPHDVWDRLRHSRLAQAGVILVALSGLADACDQLGAVDLSNLPLVGKYGPAILALAGVAKISLRLIVLVMKADDCKEDHH